MRFASLIPSRFFVADDEVKRYHIAMTLLRTAPTRHLRTPRANPESIRPLNATSFQRSRAGVLSWTNGLHSLVHPYDAPVIDDYLPSNRIWRRSEHTDSDGYATYQYGLVHFRAAPLPWLPIELDSVWIGDLVEVSSITSYRQPLVGVVREVRWNWTVKSIEYRLARAGELLPGVYWRYEFRLL